jgi:glycosyltransferase involved in cell wall biosynthesis
MKVAIVTERFYPAKGGVETYVYNLSRGLVKDGYDVTIFTTDTFSYDPPIRLPPQCMECGVNQVKVFRATKPLIGIEATAIAPLMTGSLLKGDFDVIHAQNYVYFPAYACAFVKAFRRAAFVLTAHSSPRTGAPAAIRRFYDFTLGKFALSMADHLIALTQKERKYLNSLGVHEHKISVIPHGIDVEKFTKPTNPNDFREKYNVTGKMVLYVGRLAPRHKGLTFLVNAIPKVLKEEPNTTFVLVGPDAGMKSELIKLSRKLNVYRKMVFTGSISDADLVKAYHASDLFVLPSTFEPFGMVLLEAMASGKPIVASNVDGIPEVIEDGENGLLVPPADADKLASAITTLLKDRHMAERIKKNNLLKARSYSLQRVVKATEKVYELAIKQSRNKA